MSTKQETKAKDYRIAADRVWELAREYEKKGLFDLAFELKHLADQLHDLARVREQKEDENK